MALRDYERTGDEAPVRRLIERRIAAAVAAAVPAEARRLDEHLQAMAALDELLARLGAAVLIEWHNRGERGDVDGGWLQDEAEKIGVVLAEPKTEPCGDVCPCEEYHARGPWTCYPIADGLLERAEVLSGNAP